MIMFTFNVQVLVISKAQRATSQSIANNLEQVKEEALLLRSLISEELSMVEERCDTSGLDQVQFFS